MFKSKRMKELEELVEHLQEKLEEATKAPIEIFTLVQVPGPNDQVAFHTKISSLADDPIYMFYIDQLRRKATEGFERMGKDNAEFYRGKLAAFGEIILDARQSRVILQNGMKQETEKE